MSGPRQCRRVYTAEEVAEIFAGEDSDGDDFDDLLTGDEFRGMMCNEDDDQVDDDGDQAGGSAAGGVSTTGHDLDMDEQDEEGGGDEEEEEEGSTNPLGSPSAKRLRTANRLVNSIDAALEPDNYDPMPLPALTRWHTWTANLGPAKKKNVEKISWTDKPAEQRGRQMQCDIVKGNPGLRSVAAKAVSTIRDAFDLFITPAMVDLVVRETNKKIEVTISKLREPPSDKTTFINTTDEPEIYAFFGLMYFRGLLGLNNHSVDTLFSEKAGHPVFGGTMSRNRFKFLSAHLAFDDIATRPQRWKHDRFAAFRELFNVFNNNCSRHLVPSEYLSLDETLYPMRNHVSFKQYNPDKPAKYGILFKSVNDARQSYTYRTFVYAGKPVELPSPHYIKGTQNYIQELVTSLDQVVSLQGRNISMDRLYTSIATARWLLEKNITCVGTLMSNRIGIPGDIKTTKDRATLSSKMYWEKESGDLVITSYVVNTSKGKKNILILSTTKPLRCITRDDSKQKPAVFKLYDFTKGGTDNVDQRIGSYTTKAKSPRWTKAALSFVLDTTRVNAATVYALKKKIQPKALQSFDVGWDLAEALVLPFASARPAVGLSMRTQQKVAFLLGNTPSDTQLAPPSETPSAAVKRRRCHCCLKALVGTQGYKEEKDRLTKVKTVCKTCAKPCCSEHSTRVCMECT